MFFTQFPELPEADISCPVIAWDATKRGRGAAGKVAVFGLLKRGGKVYTAIIPDAKTETLLPIIREKVEPDSLVYTDNFRSYNALDVSEFHHLRINHSELFADQRNLINGIENFWNQAKRHLRRFNGIKKENFHWFLKECEWRFNGGNHQMLLKQLKYWVKQSQQKALASTAPKEILNKN